MRDCNMYIDGSILTKASELRVKSKGEFGSMKEDS